MLLLRVPYKCGHEQRVAAGSCLVSDLEPSLNGIQETDKRNFLLYWSQQMLATQQSTVTDRERDSD